MIEKVAQLGNIVQTLIGKYKDHKLKGDAEALYNKICHKDVILGYTMVLNSAFDRLFESPEIYDDIDDIEGMEEEQRIVNEAVNAHPFDYSDTEHVAEVASALTRLKIHLFRDYFVQGLDHLEPTAREKVEDTLDLTVKIFSRAFILVEASNAIEGFAKQQDMVLYDKEVSSYANKLCQKIGFPPHYTDKVLYASRK